MARNLEEKFLDYLEGSLTEREAAEMKSALENDGDLQSAFRAYQRVVAVEKRLAGEEHKPGPQLAVKVMDRLEDESSGLVRRLYMAMSKKSLQLASGAAFVATLVMVFALSSKVPGGPLQRRASEQMVESTGLEKPGAQSTAETPPSKSDPAPRDKDQRIAEKIDQSVSPVESGKLRMEQRKEEAQREPLAKESQPAPVTQALHDAKPVDEKVAVLKRLDETRRSLDGAPQASSVSPSGPLSAGQPFTGEKKDAEKRKSIEAPVVGRAGNLAGGEGAGNLASGSKQNIQSLDRWSGGSGSVDFEEQGPPSSEREQAPDRQRVAAKPQGNIGFIGSATGNVRPNKGISGIEGRSDDSAARRVRSPKVAASMPQAEPAADRVVEGIMAPPPPAPIPEPVPAYPRQPRDVDQDDNYKTYEEQPRIQTKDEPMSTFSVDVDTASYTNARRYLQAGSFPPASSVRIEEFVNYFDYNYPSQREKPFQLTYEIAPAPLESDRLLLSLGIRARDAVAESKAWNLVFLIDVSGSMSPPDRLELIKKGLHVLVQNMRQQDKVAIVTYAGAAGLVLDGTSVKESSKILAAIDGLNAGGSTNGEGGIHMAYEVAERNRIVGGVNRVVLATDGDFNVGVTSNDSLVKLIEEKRKSGVTLTTLGVGTNNLKDARLEQLANKGNGNFFYLDSFQEARRVLGEKIAGTVEVVAKDVKLQIEFNPQHVAQYRLIGYDNRKLAKEDFNNDAIDAGEIGVGHEVTALYEVVLTNTELARRLNTEYRYRALASESPAPVAKEGMEPELAFLKVRYKEPDGNVSQLLEFPIEASRVKKSSEEASADFRFASAVAYFGTLLRGSKFAGNYTYKDIAALAERSVEGDPSGQRREFVNLVKNAQAVRPGVNAPERF